MKSLLHHLPHTLPSVLVGDVDEIDTRRQATDVHRETFAFAFGRGHALAESVDDFGLLEFLASDGDEACSGIRVDSGTLTTPNIGEGMGQQERSFIASGNERRYSHSGRQLDGFL